MPPRPLCRDSGSSQPAIFRPALRKLYTRKIQRQSYAKADPLWAHHRLPNTEPRLPASRVACCAPPRAVPSENWTNRPNSQCWLTIYPIATQLQEATFLVRRQGTEDQSVKKTRKEVIMDAATLLSNSLSAGTFGCWCVRGWVLILVLVDNNVRAQATQQLEQAAQENFVSLIGRGFRVVGADVFSVFCCASSPRTCRRSPTN